MIAADSTAFLGEVGPLLDGGDLDEFAGRVRREWTLEQLGRFLQGPCRDARFAAAVALGLVGEIHVTPWLAEALHDSSDRVAHAAGQAMWSVWFRAGNESAMRHFAAAMQALDRCEYDDAIDGLTMAIGADPGFAEAYNQRGTLRYLQHEFEAAIDDCRQAVERVPLHFEAIAQMGHCYTQLGDLARAQQCYRRALQINPRLDAVAEAYERLRDSA